MKKWKKIKKKYLNSKTRLATMLFVLVVIMIPIGLFFLNPTSQTQTKDKPLSNEVEPVLQATPILSPLPSPSPTLATAKPVATNTPKNTKLFKMNSIAQWDTARPTKYPFGIYAYQKLSKVTFTFEDETIEIQPINSGVTYFKAYTLKHGENIFMVDATTETGQTQSSTFIVTNSDSLSDVDISVKGRNCSESDVQHCKSISNYTRIGECRAYKTYILCLQSKCDVNTITKDNLCQ